jgi:universal stress protein E
MAFFKSVLVGVDLLQTREHDSGSFCQPIEEAIKNGLWLAEKASAKITFFAVVDMPEKQLRALQTDESQEANPNLRSGLKALDRLVDSARQRGLTAVAKVVSGQALVDIIREVEIGRHDVIIVGTRNAGPLRRLLFGSTAMSLLHHCPCPVWVTRPDPRPVPHNILITSDFSPVSDIAIRLGRALGELSGAKVNLLHAVDFVVERKWSVGLRHHNVEEYHARVKAEALEQLAAQFTRIAGGQPSGTVELHVVAGESIADTAILEFIEQHQIDLLVMGTVARGGFAGVSIGNTSERLVTQIPCSMVAVKPADFELTIDTTTAG